MRQKNEIEDLSSCLNRAHPEEMIFVLLGRDKAAPTAIRVWAGERIKLGLNTALDDQIKEAMSCALTMENEKLTYIKPPLPDWIVKHCIECYGQQGDRCEHLILRKRIQEAISISPKNTKGV